MNNILIDTNIFIDHLRGFQPSTDFLLRVFQGEYHAQISTLTEMELFAGTIPTEAEKEKVKALLEKFTPVPVSSVIARKAGTLLRLYRNMGLVPVDALIAATSMEREAILVTKDVKHFGVIEGLLTLHPYYTE
ncbi:MAG: type II toxin-antitoxin system VapC family toxin [Dethiobacter sp.]|jgi:predicted nucleic acid-binding protein|nr:MAG: type II toxin-antitoxin system VapC family toxin [Dethiobacter sp.]